MNNFIDRHLARLRRDWRDATVQERLGIRLAVLSFLVSLMTVLLLAIQSCDTHKLANEATVQSNIAREQFDLVYRPSVEVDQIDPVQDRAFAADLSYRLKNFGTVGANALSTEALALFNDGRQTLLTGADQRVISIPAGGSYSFSAPFSKEDTNKILMGRSHLKVEIRFHYAGRRSTDVNDMCRKFTFDPSSESFLRPTNANDNSNQVSSKPVDSI